MKVEFKTDRLREALSAVQLVTPPRFRIPGLEDVLAEAEGEHLWLTGGNLTTFVSAAVEAKVERPGVFAFRPEHLARLSQELMAFEDGQMSLSVDGPVAEAKRWNATVRYGAASGRDYPYALSLEGYQWTEVPLRVLHEGLKGVMDGAADEESRPILTAVHFAWDSEGATLAAADGFRLHTHRMRFKSVLQGASNVPLATCRTVAALLPKALVPVRVGVKPAKYEICFDLGQFKVCSELVVGNFPEYRKLIPPETTPKVTVSALSLRAAVRLLPPGESTAYRLHGLGDSLTLMSYRFDDRQSAQHISNVVLPAKVEGEVRTAVSGRYLLAVLDQMKGDVSITAASPTAPVKFEDLYDPNALYVVMPKFVQW